MCRFKKKKKAHFKLFFYYSFLSVFFMNSDCSSYVMICLCIGVAYDCVSGSGKQTERDALRRGDIQKNYFLLFFFSNQCIFSLVMVTGRGHTTSANPCEDKKKIRPSVWEKSSSVYCFDVFCFIPLFQKW